MADLDNDDHDKVIIAAIGDGKRMTRLVGVGSGEGVLCEQICCEGEGNKAIEGKEKKSKNAGWRKQYERETIKLTSLMYLSREMLNGFV